MVKDKFNIANGKVKVTAYAIPRFLLNELVVRVAHYSVQLSD